LSSDADIDEPAEGPPSQARTSIALEGEPLLRCDGIAVRLGGQQILRGIDLALPAGSVLGVLGPSGAGKSTLFKCLVGELAPQAGRAILQGRDMTQLPLWVRARLGLGYVPQTPSVLFELSVAKNLRTFSKLAGVSFDDALALAQEFGLDARLSLAAGQLSGGERRRLELVRAALGQPKVLVCDEPLTGLDPAMVSRVATLFRRIAGRGGAVIFADHRIAEVLPFCDEALLLVDGRVLLQSSAESFVDHPAVQERYLT
jgi:lipopolysaccharide export system ATP-binding protein